VVVAKERKGSSSSRKTEKGREQNRFGEGGR